MFSSSRLQQGLLGPRMVEMCVRMRRIRVSPFAAQMVHGDSEPSNPHGDSDRMPPRLAKAPDTSSKSSFSQVQAA
jgi:hypothetical protein